jgi:peptidoglycan biosynthesis protein MviN/MurJ (putative lipid II flippase)
MRRELVTIVYHAGAYSTEDVRRTANVLGMLLLGLMPQMLIAALATLFVILSRTVVNMTIGIFNFFLNAALDFVLRGPLGVTGIALSTTLTSVLLCGAYVWQAVRRWGSLGLRAELRPALVALTSCLSIVLSLHAMLGAEATPVTRIQALAAVATALIIGLLVHGSLMLASRSPIGPLLPAAGERMLAMPGAWLWAWAR